MKKMPKVNPEKLDEILEKAGVGERTAKKIRASNTEEPPAGEARPRGHGAASMERPVRSEF